MTVRETIEAMAGAVVLVVAFLSACAGAVAIAGALNISLHWVLLTIGVGLGLLIFG